LLESFSCRGFNGRVRALNGMNHAKSMTYKDSAQPWWDEEQNHLKLLRDI